MQARPRPATADMPRSVVEIARAKINLALHVLGRRDDGYHELDSVVAFADFGDRLWLEPSHKTTIKVQGPFAHCLSSGEDNLVLRAHALLSAHVDCPNIAFTLEKNLPVASGIGGGSADAAAVLRGILRMMDQGVDAPVLNSIALKLGADVPVCLRGQAVRMQGVGETLTPLSNPLGGAIVLVNPLVPCSTASVFKTLGLVSGQSHRSALDPDMPGHWRNDLIDSAIEVVPEIAIVLDALRAQPELTSVRMSGSGATCFGLADDVAVAAHVARRMFAHHPNWWVVNAALS